MASSKSSCTMTVSSVETLAFSSSTFDSSSLVASPDEEPAAAQHLTYSSGDSHKDYTTTSKLPPGHYTTY